MPKKTKKTKENNVTVDFETFFVSTIFKAVEQYLPKVIAECANLVEPDNDLNNEINDEGDSQDILNQKDKKTVKLKPIRKISEKINHDEDRWQSFNIFLDTRDIAPGMIVYVIEKIEPNEKIPYVTYTPSERIITEVQDNGVGNGTVFLSYAPKVASVSTYYTPQHNAPQIISEHDVIYSPLTKAHAEFVCKLLNLQSKTLYKKYVATLAKQEKNR